LEEEEEKVNVISRRLVNQHLAVVQEQMLMVHSY
jgi:hypothetical protein